MDARGAAGRGRPVAVVCQCWWSIENDELICSGGVPLGCRECGWTTNVPVPLADVGVVELIK